MQEERAAREAAEAREADALAHHRRELQQAREQLQAQLQSEAEARQAVEAQLGSLQGELQAGLLLAGMHHAACASGLFLGVRHCLASHALAADCLQSEWPDARDLRACFTLARLH